MIFLAIIGAIALLALIALCLLARYFERDWNPPEDT